MGLGGGEDAHLEAVRLAADLVRTEESKDDYIPEGI